MIKSSELTHSSSRRTFLKQMSASVAAGIVSPFVFGQRVDQYSLPTGIKLPRSTPEKQGISSEAISRLIKAIQQSPIEFHSLMIVRHGHVIAEGWWSPYDAPLKHTLYSLSKSFTSTAIGFAVTEKRLTVQDKVISFFPEDLPAEMSDHLKELSIQHLLTMSVGHTTGSMPSIREATETPWVKTFLSLPIEKKPGTEFLYNTGATFMLSAIIQKVTGQMLVEYLQPRLFQPLGFSDLDWETNPQGINTGGYGLRITTEDIAKFGQLYLNHGKWNGKQLIPSLWVEEATSKHIENAKPGEDGDWSQGYGYQFWRCKPGGYRADGAFGQFCIIMEEHDLVVAITSESFDMGTSMKLIWENLLPALQVKSLPANKTAQQLLERELKALTIPPPVHQKQSPILNTINGRLYQFEPNDLGIDSLVFAFEKDLYTVVITNTTGKHTVVSGIQNWLVEKNKGLIPEDIFPIQGRPSVQSAIAASSTWLDDHTLQLTWRYIETAHHDTIFCTFNDDVVHIKFQDSVAAGNPTRPERRPELIGKA